MKLNEPLGSHEIAPLLIRIPLGAFLFLEGKSKIDLGSGLVNPLFVEKIKALKLMPDQFATLYSILLPYLEIVAGTLILFGFWVTLGGIISSLIMFSYIYISNGAVFNFQKLIQTKELINLGASLALLYTGPGVLSVDKFRKGD